MDRGCLDAMFPTSGDQSFRNGSASLTHSGIRKYGEINTTLRSSASSAATIAEMAAPIDNPTTETTSAVFRNSASASAADEIHSSAVDEENASMFRPWPGYN